MEVHRPNRHLQASGDVGDEAVVYRKKLLFQRLALLRTTTLSGKLDKYSRLEGKNIPLQTDLNLIEGQKQKTASRSNSEFRAHSSSGVSRDHEQ